MDIVQHQLYPYRDRVIKDYFSGDHSVAFLANKYNVAYSCLLSFVKQLDLNRYKLEGGKARAARVSGISSRERFLLENRISKAKQDEIIRLYTDKRIGGKAIVKILKLDISVTTIYEFLKRKGVYKKGYVKSRGGKVSLVNGEVVVKPPVVADPWSQPLNRKRKVNRTAAIRDLPLFNPKENSYLAEQNMARRVHLDAIKYKTDPAYYVKVACRRRLSKFVNANDRSLRTHELVGVSSFDELVMRLEELFQPGMGWHNRGGKDGWHIDHIIPCCWFNLQNEEEQKACFNWRNLRPLWSKDNRSKGGDINEGIDSLRSIGGERADWMFRKMNGIEQGRRIRLKQPGQCTLFAVI